mgnify:CR=1 FL=1
MSKPHRLIGIPASPGYAEGPLFPISRPAASYVAKRDRAAEAAALEQAIADGRAQISALMAEADGDAGEILEFQFVMLEDNGLYQPAFERIASGANAFDAWADANPERKARATGNFRFFCETYFPEIFYLPWSRDHHRVIDKIERAVLNGGLFAMAMPRGGPSR